MILKWTTHSNEKGSHMANVSFQKKKIVNKTDIWHRTSFSLNISFIRSHVHRLQSCSSTLVSIVISDRIFWWHHNKLYNSCKWAASGKVFQCRWINQEVFNELEIFAIPAEPPVAVWANDIFIRKHKHRQTKRLWLVCPFSCCCLEMYCFEFQHFSIVFAFIDRLSVLMSTFVAHQSMHTKVQWHTTIWI